MKELVIKQDVLAPETSKTLTISGSHPSRLLSLTPGIMMDTLRITSSNFYDDELKWDTSEEGMVYFWGNWRARVKKDERTTVTFNVKIQGEQNVKERGGKVTIKIKATISSSWKFSTPLDRALGYFYLNNIYADQRRKYIEEAKRDIGKIENAIRGIFEVVEKEHHGI